METREPMTPFNTVSPEMTKFRQYLLDHGLYAYIHWHTLLIIPPLCINSGQLQEGYAVIDQALNDLDQHTIR